VSTATPVSGDATALRRRSRWLVRATISWNVVEAVVAVTAGLAAGSAALVGFGLDAAVEVSAAVVALWYLRGAGDERGRLAGRLIGASFGALALWVTVEAGSDLLTAARPEASRVGIALTGVSVVVMPVLAVAKRRTARALGSRALVAESAQTAVCAYLSAAVLGGLVLNAAFGWWWADPVAALVIAAVAVREGLEAWREGVGEDGCC
jgi:divalent metal cation (Fe/Co/Zn/Cd) transporter